MSAPATAPPRSAAEAVVVGDHAAMLRAIRSADCALAVWRRSPDPHLLARLAAFPHAELDDVEAELPIDGALPHAAALLGAAGYAPDLAVPLARETAELAACHAALWGWSRARIRLEWIETDACRRFHADRVTTRLLATYVGRGTQWKRAVEDDAAAHELAIGEVAIFKGRLLAPDAPILHRSPPIGGSGERRLLLVIDEAAA